MIVLASIPLAPLVCGEVVVVVEVVLVLSVTFEEEERTRFVEGAHGSLALPAAVAAAAASLRIFDVMYREK